MNTISFTSAKRLKLKVRLAVGLVRSSEVEFETRTEANVYSESVYVDNFEVIVSKANIWKYLHK